jgi:hypothetical protein
MGNGMRLSDDKVNQLSHVVLKALRDWDQVEFLEDDNDVRLAVKDGLVEGLAIIDGVERKVRDTLGSYSRKILEGSPEWDIMYAKAFEDELGKLGAGRE